MDRRADMRKKMLESLTTRFHLREADNLVAYYFDALPDVELEKLEKDIDLILEGKPIQYVTQTAFFYGHRFTAQEGVLIPRPETEELVHWIISDYKCQREGNILDIGAGSGCIILSVLKALDQWSGTALDINARALDLTRKNAGQLNLNVQTAQLDILNPDTWSSLDRYDVIVCNPPYIGHDEKERMGPSVLEHEPESALFVTDGDPLQFYRSVMSFGIHNLKERGRLYFETSDLYHGEMEALIKSLSLHYEFRKDMQGKWRMLKVWQ